MVLITQGQTNLREPPVTSSTSTLSAAPYLSPRARRRQLWLTIHRWLGIALLVPMALLGFSGSLQVWPEETEALLNRERAVAATADPAALSAAHISAARTGLAEYGPITRIDLGEVGSAIIATSAPYAPPSISSRGPVARQVWVDPDSTAVLDSEDTASFMALMHMLHGVLLIPDVGRQVVGIMGLFLTISGVTGLVVFWPGMRRFVAGLRWQRRDGKALNLHRQSGVVLSLVLVFEAISGAWISFPGFFASLVQPGVEQPQRPRPSGQQGTPLEAEDAAWIVAAQSAQAAYDGRLVSIAAPMTETQAWTVSMTRPGKTATVSVPLGGGAPEVKEEAARTGPPPPTTRAGAVATWMRGAHYATIGGFGWQVLVFLSGWALTFLAISGVYVWAKRELLRKKRRR
jgi:uncharacterized iron-regulated membrane protein